MSKTEPDKEAAFEELTILVHRLHETWYAYDQMFNESPERIAEMKRRAGFLFAIIQWATRDYILLGIAKAFDDDGRTLSLRRAIAQLPDPPPGSTKAQRTEFSTRRAALLKRYEDIRKSCDPILAHRNRRIAHDERVVVMGAELLPDVTLQMIREAMKGIADLCNDLSLARTGGKTGIEFIGAEIDLDPSCRGLFHVLRAGNHFLAQKEAEYRDLLARKGAGEVIEDFDRRLQETQSWFTWT